ncbi:MAG: beta-propeller domain-containing protein, partial [Candidatus Micrarchaeota archaeon]|nr:beta-propeller domain-containing protein [Candidatus Micrarchaeota archaeon]
SYALQDHKAFLFSKGKNLLVIPILLAEIDESKYAKPIPPYAYGDYTFQGAYVFSLSPTEGFVLRGRITHSSEEEMVKKGEYWWSSLNVKRSLYIGEALYTVSDGKVMAHSLGNLEKISEVKI